jgi:hypothetical protein
MRLVWIIVRVLGLICRCTHVPPFPSFEDVYSLDCACTQMHTYK